MKELVMKKLVVPVVMTAVAVLVASAVGAEDSQADNATEIAKAAQNPVADIISLPFQRNSYFQTGPEGKTQNVLLVQPVNAALKAYYTVESPRTGSDWQLQFQVQLLFPK